MLCYAALDVINGVIFMEQDNMISVKDLCVSYSDGIDIARNISFTVKKGEFLGIVGESGCGKTTMLRSLMMLKKVGSGRIKGSICFDGKEMTELSGEELRKLRGADIVMIPQNAYAAMDGTKTISSLFLETMRMHGRKVSRRESDASAAKMMEDLLLEDPQRILKAYPFELSGGMCQRVMIAAAMINNPKLILGDEPTSALDVTSQLQVVKELQLLKERSNVSMILISHNLGVVSAISDNIAIMYGGRIVEYGSRDEILHDACHPYTKALIQAVPDLNGNISKGLPGIPPAFKAEMKGCPFAERCPKCKNICHELTPQNAQISKTHTAACLCIGEN